MSLRSRPLEGGASGEGGTALFACLFLCGRNCSDFLCQPTIGTNDSFFFCCRWPCCRCCCCDATSAGWPMDGRPLATQDMSSATSMKKSNFRLMLLMVRLQIIRTTYWPLISSWSTVTWLDCYYLSFHVWIGLLRPLPDPRCCHLLGHRIPAGGGRSEKHEGSASAVSPGSHLPLR